MRYQAQAQAKAWIRIPCPASTQTLAMSTREDSITQPLGGASSTNSGAPARVEGSLGAEDQAS